MSGGLLPCALPAPGAALAGESQCTWLLCKLCPDLPSSELAQQKMGFVRVGPFWPCSENVEPEWAPFCRALSTHSLSWDCDRPGQAAESPACEESAAEPRKHPLRERAYSESHLCGESGSASRRQRQEAPLAKLEELPFTAKKKGPPPPRPPPPKWENYHPRRASHHQLLPTEAGLSAVPEDPHASSQNTADTARQRSQSLPLEQLWGGATQEPQNRPRGSTLPKEHANLHYYHHGSPRGTPEWPTPDLSGESDSSRQVLRTLCPIARATGKGQRKGSRFD